MPMLLSNIISKLQNTLQAHGDLPFHVEVRNSLYQDEVLIANDFIEVDTKGLDGIPDCTLRVETSKKLAMELGATSEK